MSVKLFFKVTRQCSYICVTISETHPYAEAKQINKEQRDGSDRVLELSLLAWPGNKCSGVGLYS